MLTFNKAGDLYLGLEHYPKAVRAYMEAIKRSYRSEAEALRLGNEKDASVHELARVQALRGMSLAWYKEGKRSANSTYSHALYGRAMDARSSARDLLVARKKDGRSSGTAKESIVDDLLQLGSIASELKDDRSFAVYARLASEEMKREQEEKRREQQDKQLRKELSLGRIYAGALEGVESGADMIERLKRLDLFIREPSQ
jgi:hypothetical protein